MIYRKDCDCPCHHIRGCMHFVACCEPDEPYDITEVVGAVPCPDCKAGVGEHCFRMDTLPTTVLIKHTLDHCHFDRVQNWKQAVKKTQ